MMRAVLLLLGLVLLASGPAAGQADKKKDDKKKDDKKAVRREPTVGGRTIAAWAKVLDGADTAAKFTAVNALMRAGPEARPAVPGLVKLLAADGSPLRFLAPIALSRVGADAVPALRKALESGTASVRAGAALALGLIGAEAKPAGPALVGMLMDKDPSAKRNAATALGQIGFRVGAGGLKKLLADKDGSVAVEAAWALWLLEKDAAGVDTLAGACADSDEALVQRALQCLTEIGPKARTAAKAILAATKHESAEVRIAAGVAAYLVVGKADEAHATLEGAMKSADARLKAVAALGLLTNDARAVTRLEGLLRDPDAAVRRESAAALTGTFSDISAARKTLTAGLDDPDVGVRWWCAVALLGHASVKIRTQEERYLAALWLGHPGAKRAEAIFEVVGRERVGPALARVLANHSGPIVEQACRAAGFAGADARPALTAMLGLFRSGGKGASRAAADAVPGLGLDAMAELRKMLGDESAAVRASAARALGGFGLPALSAVPALLNLLRDGEPAVRIQAALAAWRIDDRAEEALPIINLVLKDVDNKDRWEAADAIGMIATEASPPIRGLLEVQVNGLKDRDDAVRAVSAKWLWRRTKLGKTVMPLLRDAAGSREPLARQTAAETLGEISAEDGPAAVLAPLLEDTAYSVRVAAQDGLAAAGDVAALVKLLGGVRKGRDGAARALGMMGPKAKEALPALAKAGPGGAAALRRIFPGKGKELEAYLEAVREGKDTKALEAALLKGK